MSIVNEIFNKKRSTINQISEQNVDPNGTTFPDSKSAKEYKRLLTKLGYLFIEGSRNNSLVIRPQTEEDHRTLDLYFRYHSQEGPGLTTFLYSMDQKAQAGKLINEPLYRKPHPSN